MFRSSLWLLVTVAGGTLACAGVVPAEGEVNAPQPAPDEPVAAPKAPKAGRGGVGLPPRGGTHSEGPRPDDCTVQGDQDPILKPKQTGATLPVAVFRTDEGTAEEITFDDGLQVRLERGGCYHFGETWTIVGAPRKGDLRKFGGRLARRITMANNLLVPVLPELRDAPNVVVDGEFPCGEFATCVAVWRTDVEGVLVIASSIAL